MTEVYANLEKTMPYYGTADGSTLGASFTFNFFMVQNFNLNISDASDLARIINSWMDALPSIYTSNWVVSNRIRVFNKIYLIKTVDQFRLEIMTIVVTQLVLALKIKMVSTCW